ncbi:MAG: dienelactone hydrolase family protein [Bryobacterales bacterium]|nr:dienelactone hydrolase family protein [Bryobacterales bacterium]
MCDQEYFEQDRLEYERRGLVTRKEFGALLGMSVLLPQVDGAVAVKESEVTITTPDGRADCYFVHPAKGSSPGVLVWPDIFGLRPAFRQMGKRLAESGYAVLVVNPFYRSQKAPAPGETRPAASIDQMRPFAQALNEKTHMSDATAFTEWMAKQKPVHKKRKFGTQGYCMGGPMAFRTAAASARVGAVASFHGGGLVRADSPTSPHLQAAKTKAHFLIAVAENDDQRAPNDKTVLKDTFAAAKLPAEIEVYGAAHGWCPPDSRVYNEALAEKAWGRLLALYAKALA